MDEVTNTAEIRRINRSRIFKYIYKADGKTSKKEIAIALDLSLPTVSQNLQEMFDENLLCYSGTKASTGGRKPRTISINENVKYSVGISITDTEISFSAVDLKARQIASLTKPIHFEDSNDYFIKVEHLLEAFLQTVPESREKLIGVSITFPGIVNPKKQMLEFAPTLRMRNKEISRISSFFHDPVHIYNDANARGYAEFWEHTQENMAYLSVSRGVGGAFFCSGNGYYGDNFRSCEFGHICVEHDGRECDCGKRGCLEAYCSIQRISDDLHMTLQDFFDTLARQDRNILCIWSKYLEYLAIGITCIRNILDCDIVLGGTLAVYMAPYMPELKEKVLAHSAFDEDMSYLRLSNYNTSSACYGAALYNITEYIERV